MEEKERLLSAAREIMVGEEKLKLLFKEGKISRDTFDDEHKKINARLAQIKEQIAALDRKKNELSAPASVEKFNSSFVRRQLAGKKNNDSENESLSNAGMVAVLSSVAIFLLLLGAPSIVYSSLPALPEPYSMPESSGFYVYLAVLAAQIFAGGLFLWFVAKYAKVKSISHYEARLCSASGALITSGALSVAGYITSVAGQVPALQALSYAAGLISYYYAIQSASKVGNLTAAFLAAALYAVNYALAIAIMLLIIKLL
jgi:hypothetical protein